VKIGIISREFPPLTHVGGIATYSQTAARLLADHGHEVHVVCNGPEASVQDEDGVIVHRVPMLEHHFRKGRAWYPYRMLYRRHLPHYLDALTWARTVSQYLAARLPAGGFDAWEFPETMGEGALLPLSPGLGKPLLVCRVHSGWMDGLAANALEKRALLRLQKKACLKSDRLLSPSRYMATEYVQGILGLPRPATVNPNPLRLWPQPLDGSAKRLENLLYVGRVEHRKGLHVLLKALDEMGADAKGITLRVVGGIHPPTRAADRECADFFRARLADKEKAYTLEHAGLCGHGEMHRHFDWAGLLVIPSLIENYPYVALEGLSRGCFVLGSDVGGLPEIIDRPERGELFAPENSTQLARKIRECRRRDRLILEECRINAERMREDFAPEACYRRLLQAYGKELPQRAGG
jgi:glycosyltransferase involved in cell wall biosynthesis